MKRTLKFILGILALLPVAVYLLLIAIVGVFLMFVTNYDNGEKFVEDSTNFAFNVLEYCFCGKVK